MKGLKTGVHHKIRPQQLESFCHAIYGDKNGIAEFNQRRKQGHPTTIFGKYLFGGRFEIHNFRNICYKISCLPAPPRIFEHLNNGIIAHFNGFLPLKGHLESSGAFFLAEILEKVSFDPYNFRITRLSARNFEQGDEKFLGDKNMPISTV